MEERELKRNMDPEDLELNKRQINALLELEKVLKRCARNHVTIYGRGRKLLGYNGTKLDAARKKRCITMEKTEFGQVPYTLIDDAGVYKNSGPDAPLYIRKRKKKRREK
jgi:hypothetical protein